jgi:hypothetical protein
MPEQKPNIDLLLRLCYSRGMHGAPRKGIKLLTTLLIIELALLGYLFFGRIPLYPEVIDQIIFLLLITLGLLGYQLAPRPNPRIIGLNQPAPRRRKTKR